LIKNSGRLSLPEHGGEELKLEHLLQFNFVFHQNTGLTHHGDFGLDFS